MANFTVPEGMTPEQLSKIVASYQKKQVTQYAGGKAKREAVQALIKAHKPEYDALLAKTKKVHGVA
jgi:hypothetical protein